jgi:hypothetical protein
MNRLPRALTSKLDGLSDQVRTVRLRPWPAAVIGAAGGLAVGGLITLGMVRNAVFTGPHQGVTAGAVLIALWLTIGAIAALTVLSPEDDGAPQP